MYFEDGITSPIGGEAFVAGSVIGVTWSTGDLAPLAGPTQGAVYAKVEFVTVEASLDSGQTYDVVGSGITAADGQYSWGSPFDADTAAALVRVRFQDKFGGDVFLSTSPAAFAIQPMQLLATGMDTGLQSSVAPYALLYLDADNDGDQDLLLSKSDPSQDAALWEARENPNRPTLPSYTPNLTAIPGVAATRSGHVADYEGDGDLDIVLAGASRGWLLRNEENGTGALSFTDQSGSHPAFSASSDSSWSAAFADFDREVVRAHEAFGKLNRVRALSSAIL